jgi:hydrogenase maturation protein HypF
VQAASGFLAGLDALPDLAASPFSFPSRYFEARQLIDRGLNTWTTTSMGRLFDTVAALLGFTRPMTFEGQAAMWLEHLAGGVDAGTVAAYDMPFDGRMLDFGPMVRAVICDRLNGRHPAEIACAAHLGIAQGTSRAAMALCQGGGVRAVVLSGGVFQNMLLLRTVRRALRDAGLEVWLNHQVPANDGGLSLGQAAIAACRLDRES